MAPIITSTGQTRSRLPPKWMQNATIKASAAATVNHVDHDALAHQRPVRWSTHTLAADHNDTIRSCADSTTSTYVADTFAHRGKGRISDVTFVNSSEDAASADLTRSDSHNSSFNDLSLTLNDDDDISQFSDFTKCKPTVPEDAEPIPPVTHDIHVHLLDSDDDDMARRIDQLMAATMEALEASNRLVLDTLSTRAKLAQFNAMEAALDSQLDAREAHLLRQIQAVTDMTDFVSKTSAQLQDLTSPFLRLRVSGGAASAGQPSTLADTAELQVRDAAATGIVQALDRDATIGKTAAKRLERMLQTSSPNTSPSSFASPQRRNAQNSRRAFSISDFASKHSSIEEEGQHESEASPSTPDSAARQQNTGSTATSPGTISSSRTSTPQKKRAISYDSRSPGALRLLTKFAGPSKASTHSSSPALSGTSANAASSFAPNPVSISETDATGGSSGSSAFTWLTTRPSLLATLSQESILASSRAPSASNAVVGDDVEARSTTKNASGLPRHSSAVGSKAGAHVGVASTEDEAVLAALLGMPPAARAALTPPRTETPSESSYFDSAMGESISSVSPPTPGSVHAIEEVLATPWKSATEGLEREGVDAASSLQRSARRTSIYSSALSPRASLSISDRDRAQHLSSQLAELRAERVMWNSQHAGSAEISQSSKSTSASDARGGGALRALQRLNEMSAAKIGAQRGPSAEDVSSKRMSLGLGLPSFSNLRPSASRSTSTTAAAATSSSCGASGPAGDKLTKSADPKLSHDKAAIDPVTDAADVGASGSLLGGGWRSWASWNTASAVADSENTTAHKYERRA